MRLYTNIINEELLIHKLKHSLFYILTRSFTLADNLTHFNRQSQKNNHTYNSLNKHKK